MVVDVVDVSEKFINKFLRTHHRLMNEDGPAEINASLNQIFGAKVVAGERSLIISAKGTFHRVNATIHAVLIEEGHACSGIFGFLVPKSRI